MKKLAQSFLGRRAALDPLLAAGDRLGLEDVLRRNVYTEVAAPQPTAVSVGSPTISSARSAGSPAQDGAALLTGSVRFAPAAGA